MLSRLLALDQIVVQLQWLSSSASNAECVSTLLLSA
jgi:hypothetical protein